MYNVRVAGGLLRVTDTATEYLSTEGKAPFPLIVQRLFCSARWNEIDGRMCMNESVSGGTHTNNH